MNEQPLVTIGIPAFKGKNFRAALESWLRQTYENFEVFVQDDASPDDLLGIFNETCGNDPRFHFERNTKNSSPYFVENWMKTLNKANGVFFVLGSDDDLYEPEYLSEMVALAQKYPSVDFFDCNHDLFNEIGTFAVAPLAPEVQTQIDWIYALVYSPRYVVAQSAMCRVSALRAIGGFDNLPAAWGACDWMTWCKMAKNGVATAPRVLMHWRGDGGNTSSAVNRYWLRQKIKAIELARPKWRDIVVSLHPQDKVEEYKYKFIYNKIVNRYFWWFPSCTYANLPVDMYLEVLVKSWKLGLITFRYMLGAIRRRFLGR